MASPENWMRTARAKIAARFVAFGLGSNTLIVAGLAIGLAAIPLIAMRYSWIAAVVLIAGFCCAVLGRTNADARWCDLSQTFDLIILAGAPFAFALADTSRAVAACFLLFGLVTTVAASLFAQHLHRLNATDRGLCVSAFVLACTMPQWFSLIAYVIGLAGFVSAGARVLLTLTRSGS